MSGKSSLRVVTMDAKFNTKILWKLPFFAASAWDSHLVATFLISFLSRPNSHASNVVLTLKKIHASTYYHVWLIILDKSRVHWKVPKNITKLRQKATQLTRQLPKGQHVLGPDCTKCQLQRRVSAGMMLPGFPPTLENLEKWDNFFQSGKSQGILKKCQKVREKSGNFKWVREKSGKTVIHKLKFNQSRIKI